ncbi:MAG: DUF255 domain-containing protein [Pirellulaceae bacterium]
MRGARQIILTTTVLLACHSGLWAQSRIEWAGNWAEAQTLATRHQRLILIHFWNADCAPCLKLERSVFIQPEFIRSIGTNYVALKVNVTENPDLVRHYAVQQWPTDLILTADGQELYRGISPPETNQYIDLLDQIAAHARLGMPIGVNTPPNFSASTASSRSDQTSAFPTSSTSGSAFLPSNYQPPSSGFPLPGTYNSSGPPTAQSAYNTAPPAASSSAGMAYNPNASYGAADAPPARDPAADPAYVTNHWVAPGAQSGQSPIAERRASYTTSQGGDFQTSSASPAAGRSDSFPISGTPRSTLGPASSSSAQLGPPTFDVSASGPTLNGSGTGSPNMGPPIVGPPNTRAQQPPASSAGNQDPPLALEGYCPVTLVEREKWVKGDPKYGAYHRGRTYLFAGPQEQARFLDPAGHDKYAPALSGYDAVKYAEQGALVDGKRVHGVFYRGQVFLFADEAALQQFWTAPERYAPTVRAEQERSAMRSGLQR